MSFHKVKVGPSSAARKRKGGKARGHKKNLVSVIDFDVTSCFFGIIEKVIGLKQVSVIDMRNARTVHCTLRGMTSKFLIKGSLVVFSLIKGDTTGEVIASYSTDHLQNLCEHFKTNYEKASKMCGIATTINRSCSNELPEIMIAEEDEDVNEDNIKNKPIKSNGYLDLEFSDENSDDDVSVKEEDENSDGDEEDPFAKPKPFRFGKSLNKFVEKPKNVVVAIAPKPVEVVIPEKEVEEPFDFDSI